MPKLTDAQLVVLSAAAAREDGAAICPDRMNKTAAAKVVASLVSRKLMQEVEATSGMPVWREDEDHRPIALIITRQGLKVIGVDEEGAAAEQGEAGGDGRNHQAAPRCDHESVEAAAPTTAETLSNQDADDALSAKEPCGAKVSLPLGAPRAGSKQALVVEMLSREGGATIDALAEATGWLSHTTRAALTGLRKRGLAVARERREGQPSVYRIEAVSQDA